MVRRIIFLFIALTYLIVNYYFASKVIRIIDSLFSYNASLIIYPIIFILSVTTLTGFFVTTFNIGFFGKIGMYWFSIILVSSVVFGGIDLIAFVISRFFSKNTTTLNEITSQCYILGVLVIILLVSYGILTANHVKTTHYVIDIKKENRLNTLKIVMFSDLHLGYINDEAFLKKAIREINKISPDVIFISGDFFDGNYYAVQNPKQIQKLLKTLKSKYGIYMVWGNHDAGDSFNKMRNFILSSNIKILEDELFEIENILTIIGRKDSSPIGNQGNLRKKMDYDIKNINTNLPIIVLDHQPTNINEYAYADLILSGHTHQGQIFPLNLITNLIFTVDYGYYKSDNDTITIVSSGLGTWGPPIRLGTISEIIEIDVTFRK